MDKRFLLIVVFAGALGLWHLGCSSNSSNNPTQPPMTDQTALQTQVATSDSVADFTASDETSIDDNGLQNDEYDGVASLPPSMAALEKVTADSLYPVRWGRVIFWNQIVRTYTVVIVGDTEATVTINKTIPGQFLVAWGTRTPDTTIVDTIVKKPFSESAERLVRFKRVARTTDPLRNWIPVALTLVQGKTDSVNNKFSIVSLAVSENGIPFNQTITDPLNTWFRLGIFHTTMPVFPAGDSVDIRVTITSSDSLPEMVYLHHGIAGSHLERRRVRMPLVATSGPPGNRTRVYDRMIHVGLPTWAILAARFNAVVDVFSRGSVYDNSAPFSNEFWGLPYIVVR